MRHATPPRVLTAAVLAGVLLAATPVFAGPPTDRLRELFAGVNRILADGSAEPLEKVARVKRLVNEIADVRAAAEAALDAEWQARSAAEREEFTRLFAELLERGFVARLAATVSPVSGMAMTYGGETRVGDETRVTTDVVGRDGRKMIVEYRMAERRGRWLVHDVVVDGISTVDNYRAQFRRLLRQGSYADLVASLRAKLGEETLMFAHAAPATTAPRVAEKPVLADKPGIADKKVEPTRVASRTPVAVVPPPIAKTPQWITAAPEPVAKPVAPVARAAVMTVTRPLPPPADVVSPFHALDLSGLPSALFVVLGLAGVSGAVYLRRRASAPLLLQPAGAAVVVLRPVGHVARVVKPRPHRRKRGA
ncbi:MAG TPA: ABC transporter substrate-binding protein [Methylomirabilota bacterium]|nr:ABC transporter substrate-binding protein [Methylomirabilota bacterium]